MENSPRIARRYLCGRGCIEVGDSQATSLMSIPTGEQEGDVFPRRVAQLNHDFGILHPDTVLQGFRRALKLSSLLGVGNPCVIYTQEGKAVTTANDQSRGGAVHPARMRLRKRYGTCGFS